MGDTKSECNLVVQYNSVKKNLEEFSDLNNLEKQQPYGIVF